MFTYWAAALFALQLLLPLSFSDAASLDNEARVAIREAALVDNEARAAVRHWHSSALRGSTDFEPDSQALDKFVRHCTVAMAVHDANHLPTDALDAFCGTTENVVECRLELSSRLIKVHKEGLSIGNFCKDVYNWNAQTHGMLCPFQCEKLQCVSTCQWLDEQRNMTAQGIANDKINEEAMQEEDLVKKLRDEIKDKQRENLQYNRSIAQFKTNLDRAETVLGDAEEELATAEENLANTTKAVANLESAFAKEEKNMINQTNELQAMQFHRDKFLLNHKQLESNATLQHKWLMKREETLKSHEMSIKKATEVLNASDKIIGKLETELEHISELSRAKALEVVDATKAEGRAIHSLKEAIKEDAPEEALDDLGALVKTKTRIARKKEEEFVDLASDHKKLNFSIQLNEKESLQLSSELLHHLLKAKNISKQVLTLEQNFNQSELRAQQYWDANLKGTAEKITLKKQRIKAIKENKSQVTRALNFQMNMQRKDRMPAVENKKSRMENARKELRKVKADLLEAEETHNKSATLIAKLEEREQRETAAFEAKNGEVMKKLNALRKETDAHTLARPEIVRQHALSLWNFMKVGDVLDVL